MGHNTSLKLGILILNENGKPWLSTIYESIRRQGYPGTRMYLVDNCSEDGSVEFTIQNYPEVNVIYMPRNLGYSMAYNLAMPYAFEDGCEWVVWANNDIKLEPGCLDTLTEAAHTDVHIGVLGPAFLAWDRDDPNYYMLGNHPYAISAMNNRSPKPMDVEWVEGSFLMVSRCCLEAVGPLDPYLYFYWEEADFCRRARFQGWRIVLVPNAFARHYGGGWSEGNQGKTAAANALLSRNYYIYKLANPFGKFSTNLLAAFHLVLVHLRQNFSRDASSTIFHIRIFANVLREINSIHKKWKRDRAGIHPPKTIGKFPLQKVEVLPGRRPLLS